MDSGGSVVRGYLHLLEDSIFALVIILLWGSGVVQVRIWDYGGDRR